MEARLPAGREQMTLCAVVCAAVFPVVRGACLDGVDGLPLPGERHLAGQPPLMWDVMAVAYFLLSLLYWLHRAGAGFRAAAGLLRGALLEAAVRMADSGLAGTGRQWHMKRPACFCGHPDSPGGIRPFRGEL